MKAIRVHEGGGPEVMKLEEVQTPEVGPGLVLVKIHAAGVNPVDAYIRAGGYFDLQYPYTPGMDGAGVVEAVGEGVKRVRAGDRVYCGGSITGAYAQYALCSQDQVYLLPENISFAQGAALWVPYGTAAYALLVKARAKAGETVLVHGATGGVGVAAVQLARSYGLTVYGTGGTEAGRQMVRQQGAHEAFDHTAPDYLDHLTEATGGRGVDIVLEMLANVNLQHDLEVLASNGRVIVIGSRGPVELLPRDIMRKHATVLGFILMNATPAETRHLHAVIAAGLEQGALRPIIREEIPLDQAPRAHELVLQSGAYGKIVLIP